jgi:hypothetical protein
MIGYGENLSEKDVQLFIDITKKHHLNREVLIYNNDEETARELLALELERAGDLL